jgi:predicted GIY-YIG superfamily endonuclease
MRRERALKALPRARKLALILADDQPLRSPQPKDESRHV